MVRAKHTVDIQRLPATVWDYLTDFKRNPEWLTQVIEVRVGSDTVGPGTRITEVRRVPGRTVEATLEVAEWQPPHRLRKVSASGAVRVDGLYELVPTSDGGTRLTFTLSISAGGLFKPAEWLMGWRLQEGTEEVLRNLKQRVEGEFVTGQVV